VREEGYWYGALVPLVSGDEEDSHLHVVNLCISAQNWGVFCVDLTLKLLMSDELSYLRLSEPLMPPWEVGRMTNNFRVLQVYMITRS
jgi:hypothetical protein